MSRSFARSRFLDDQRGASTVEFAILTPLIFMIMFGVLTGGLAWNRKQTLTSAAREAARFGATLAIDHSDPDTWLGGVETRALDSAFGDLHDTVDGRYICVAFVHIDPDDGDQTVNRETGDDRVEDGEPCFHDGRPAGEPRAQVIVERPSPLIAVLFNTDITLQSGGVARYEEPIG